MAYPLFGDPTPTFIDESGDPYASGTLTITNPSDAAIEVYSTAANAIARTSGSTAVLTLDAAGQPPSNFQQIWGRSDAIYKIILKDSSGSTIWTIDDLSLPDIYNETTKVKTADTTRSSTTTLTADDHLTGWELEANEIYKVTGYFLVTADAASRDFKVDAAVNQLDSSVSYICADATTAGTVDQGFHGDITDSIIIDIDGTANVGIIVDGHITQTSTDADYDVLWAQGTAAGSTTLKKGSWLKIEYLGDKV